MTQDDAHDEANMIRDTAGVNAFTGVIEEKAVTGTRAATAADYNQAQEKVKKILSPDNKSVIQKRDLRIYGEDFGKREKRPFSPRKTGDQKENKE